MAESNSIIIRGAREHNLKNISLTLPRNKLILVTGLSGSGKSSLAFDTLYAEGQRRFVESLSSYARQFLEQLQKPDVDSIDGLSPAIAIEQRSAGSNPRSTVATQTEIYDYLRLLFARVGTVYCYKCHKPINRQSAQEIVEHLFKLPELTEIYILAPIIYGKKGEYKEIFSQIVKSGFTRCRVDKEILELPLTKKLEKYKIHTIEIVVDRLTIKPEAKARITESVETALKTGKGLMTISFPKDAARQEMVFNESYTCSTCGLSFAEVQPRIFSFNSPYGACPECNGLGITLEFDEELIIPDKTKSIRQGALAPWKRGGRGYMLYYRWLLSELAQELDFDLDKPFKQLSKSVQKAILYGCDIVVGSKPFEGIIPHLKRLFNTSDSDYVKEEISKFMASKSCSSCHGARLKKESLSVLINGKNIWEVTQMSITQAQQFFTHLDLSLEKAHIARQVLKALIQKLTFCINVGLDYLTLNRKSATLSGGEAQRIRLATQVGSGLVGVMYVLDEPSIGLHQRDNDKLISTLKALRDLGNTLVVVEHDEYTIRESDYIIDLGPGPGVHGGDIVYAGPTSELLDCPQSLTAQYLRQELVIPVPKKRRKALHSSWLVIHGAKEHNLKNITVKIPLGVFVCVTGVSGSGKSTLIDDILFKALSQKLYESREKPGEHQKISGLDQVDKVIVVDQSPIGRSPRSNPATYTKTFDHIRQIFSQLPLSKQRGYQPGRFSFNVKGGRCEACQGDGIKKIEMHFLPDVYVKCDVCKGMRFNDSTLEVKFKGKSITDVLEMTVEDARELFAAVPAINNGLAYLVDVGLGYITLGQSATTLSGGEAQRIKLAAELSKRSTGKTVYILDEPTTGLHFADIDKLLLVLQRLVDKGNTILVIEHNLDVIKSADYIIDLGPEGGDNGGTVVASGTPEEIASCRQSFTGQYLQKVLQAIS